MQSSFKFFLAQNGTYLKPTVHENLQMYLREYEHKTHLSDLNVYKNKITNLGSFENLDIQYLINNITQGRHLRYKKMFLL